MGRLGRIWLVSLHIKTWCRLTSRSILQYIPRNMHTVFALLCFVVVIHWLIFPYPSGLLHWHCGNLTIAPVPAKQPWWIWINTSCEIIMNDYITQTKQSTTKPCAYLLGYTVALIIVCWLSTPSHYLNQCRLIISEAVWRSPEGNPTWNAKKNMCPWQVTQFTH